MATIVTRAGKGSPLTSSELDQNQINLNTDKAELSGAVFTGAITTNSTIDGRDVAADGVTADAALPKSGGAMTGAITTNSTFDGRDVAADGVTADAALPKAGGAMTGAITTNSTFDGVDIATRDAVLTSTTTTANAALPKAGGAVTGDISFGDNDKAIFGAGSDLQIYHDGSNSHIHDSGTGNLDIRADSLSLLNAAGSEYYARFYTNGAANLYHDGSLKINTTSTGIDVTGLVAADSLTVDNFTLDGTTLALSSGDMTLDAAGDIILDADGGDFKFRDGGAGFFTISNSSLDAVLTVGQQNEDFIVKGYDGASLITALTLDMSAAGDAIFNNFVTAQRFYVPDAGLVILGGGGDLKLSSDGTNGLIETVHGNLTLDAAGTITLDADNTGTIYLKDGGTTYGQFFQDSNRFFIQSTVSDADMLFRGSDAGTVFSALTLDMSAAGAATFNAGATFGGSITGNGDLTVGNSYISNNYAQFANMRVNNNAYIGSESTPSAVQIQSGGGVAFGYDVSVPNISVADDIRHTGDSDTYISFEANNQTYYSGGTRALDLASGSAVFNEGGGDVDFRIESNGNANALFVDGGGDRVGIGLVPNYKLDVLNTTGNVVSARFTTTATAAQSYGPTVVLTNDPNDTTRYFFSGTGGTTDRIKILSNGNIVNTNNSYTAISDEKLKENIVDAGSQWDDIKALRVRKYSLKEENASEPTQIGVIAQEVEAAGMSGLVYETPDQDTAEDGTIEDTGEVTKNMKYSILYMKAIKALQEAMTRIETLETRLTALENA